MNDVFFEQQRLEALHALEIVSGVDPGMDQICALASDLFGSPVALVTLLDEKQQWLKARCGLDMASLPRETAFCNYTIRGADVLVVEDAKEDERFASNPLVTGEPHIRFYAGAPLELEPGFKLGALCLVGFEPRKFCSDDRRRLAQLALLVVNQIRLHAANLALERNARQLELRQSALEWTSTHDALTGLANRVLFQEAVEKAVENAHADQRGAVLIMDLDEFKRVNDLMGRECGDALLVAVGLRLTELVSSRGMVARLDSDEFGILLPKVQNAAAARAFSDEVALALRMPVQHGRYAFNCSGSIGEALFPDHASTAPEILRCADLALYAAKDEGRNRSVLFRSELRDRLLARITVLDRARHALKTDAIIPYYQPKVSLSTGAIVGFEALLRWRDPILGIQSPITIWEAFNDPVLSVEIGCRMREKVMADMAAWRDQRVPFGAVAINVSAAEFIRGDLATTILDSMAAFRLPTDTLELEVTETVFLGDGSGEIGDALKTLSDDGVAIALDDFGTGYASLTHLRQFPVSWLKIDKSFVSDMNETRESAAIVKMCIELAQSFGIGVVAEGVETEAQVETLKSWNCDVVQGYHFGKPITASLVPSLLAGWSQKDAEALAARQYA